MSDVETPSNASGPSLPLFQWSEAQSQGSPGPKKAEPKPLTVTQFTQSFRNVVEPAFEKVWICGEISNFRPAASGHVYFSLKDEGASLACAIFGWGRKSKSLQLKNSLQVICRGRVTVFAPRGSYQLIVDHIEAVGAGLLQQQFEELKLKLQQEGLFDPARKRALPRFPRRLAIITSPSGAALQDMLNILKRRAPHMEVVVVPARVQGDGAAAEVTRALNLSNELELGDIVVIARGGGSMEDLWCFNDEGLARAVAASSLPVLSAVGHEIDFTLCDFSSDLRAPTPSAAAEIVSNAWVQAAKDLGDMQRRLRHAVERDLAYRKRLLQQVAQRLRSPRDRLKEQVQRCDELMVRFQQAVQMRLQGGRREVLALASQLDALSPLRVLQRGYSIVLDAEGEKVIKRASQLLPQSRVTVRFSDGDAPMQVL